MARAKGVKWDSKKFRLLVEKEMMGRLFTIGAHVESVVVKSISKDQPVRRSVTKDGSPGRLVGTTKAKAGAPPRVLEGRLVQSITHVEEKGLKGPKTSIGSNVVYAARLEYEGHPYLRPAITASKKFILKTLGRGMVKKKR